MFPYISKELLAELNTRFPNVSPKAGETLDELKWRGGQRSVVDFLTTIPEEQLASNLGE